MNELNIEFAQYSSLYGEVTAINAIIGGITMSVPLDPANTTYAEILRQVEAGTLTIEEADNGSE